MNKSRWITPLIIAVILILGIGLYLQRPREYEYQGKAVSDWLEELDSKNSNESKALAREAFRQMGTNVLPALLEILRSWETGARQRQIASANQQNMVRQEHALNAVEALGPAAIPVLTQLLTSENGLAAARALSHAGPEALAPLSQALTNQSAKVRQTVELGLDSMGDKGKAFVPSLIQNLKDQDALVRGHAAMALGRLGQEPATAVPALAGSLQDPNADVRLSAAQALGHFGAQAAPAIPALLSAAKAQDNRVYRAIFNSLKQIDPEAAKRAGVK